MHTNRIRGYLDHPSPDDVELHYFDRTLGETTENFYVCGNKGRFSDIYHFVANAIYAIAESDSFGGASLEEVEAVPCASESWMQAFNARIDPGSCLSFPPVEVLGFTPPPLEKVLYVFPAFSPVEEAVACESKDQFVLLYWYTTG